MITYKPSARLGLLNEENFTSDPTARGWTETKTLTGSASTAFGANGYTATCPVSSAVTLARLEKTNLSLSQYFRIIFTTTNLRYHAPTIRIYLNNIKVLDWQIASNLNYSLNTFTGTLTIFKNSDTDWKVDHIWAGYIRDSSFSTINVGSGTVNSIKLEIVNFSRGSSGEPANFSITGLRWV